MAKSNFIVRGGGDFSQLEKDLLNLQKKMSNIGKSLESAGKTMTTAFTLPIIGAGTAAVKMAADFGESQSRMETVLGDLSSTGTTFAQDFSNAFGISKKAITDNIASIVLMGTNYGLAKDSAYGLAESMTQVTADVSAFNNMPFEETSERLMGALRGEGEAAEALGLSINQTTLAEYARKQGIEESITSLDQATLMNLRYGLIQEQTAAMAGFAAKENNNFAAVLTRLQTTLQNVAVPLGEILIPYITTAIQKVTEVTQKFQGLDEEQQQNIIKIGLLVAAIGPALAILGSVISTLGTLVTWFSGVRTAMLAVQAGTSGLSAVFTAMFGPAGPVLIAIAVIAALVAAGVLLYKNWDEIKAKASEIWGAIKTTVGSMVDGIKTNIKGGINGIIGMVNKFISYWNKIKLKVPEINIPFVGKVGGFTIGLPSIKEIPMLATGGIINSPTLAMLGEAGPEAVVPLENTSFVDAIASAVATAVMNAMQFGSSVSSGLNEIIMTIDGTKFARIVLPKLNDEAERMGFKPVLQP